MLNKGKVMALLACVLVTGMLMGCSTNSSKSSSSTAAATSTASKKIVIGFSQCTLESPFYVALMDEAKAEAATKGAQLIYADAQSSVSKQNSDIQDLISKGINVLVLNAQQADGYQSAISAAKAKGIAVIEVDRNVNGDITSFVGRDNKAMGALIGKKAVELLGGAGNAKGTILEVQGAAGDKVMMARRDGFHSAVDQEKGIKVIQTPYCDYVRSKAVAAAQDAFQAHKDISLIYAHNDDMALGALQVANQMGLKNVKVVGIDGLMEAVKGITQGTYVATTCNDPAYEGKLAVDAAIDAASGKTVEANIDAGTALIDSSNASKYYDPSKTFAAYIAQ